MTGLTRAVADARALITADARAWLGEGRPTVRAIARLWLLEAGFQLTVAIRLRQVWAAIPAIGPGLAQYARYCGVRGFGCDIAIGAEFGPGLYIPHPIGIVIGGEARVGRDVAILQGVTLGRTRSPAPLGPLIGDGVKLNAGAIVVGAVTVGARANIGAGAVVVKDVPPGAVVGGNPARVLRNADGSRPPTADGNAP